MENGKQGFGIETVKACFGKIKEERMTEVGGKEYAEVGLVYNI